MYAYAWYYLYTHVHVFAMLLAQAVLTQTLTQNLCFNCCTESFNVYSFKENKAIQKMVVLCRDFRKYCLEKSRSVLKNSLQSCGCLVVNLSSWWKLLYKWPVLLVRLRRALLLTLLY